jgi:flagellar hook-associated protein 3 FlgL
MRISTQMIYSLGSSSLNDLQSQLMKTQQQLSSQKRILTPADDPVASATLINLSQSASINTQLTTNRSTARSQLQQEESVLSSVTTLMQSTKTLIVNAGNGAMDDSQRSYLATQLQGYMTELLGLANSKDGNGQFMFAGYTTSSQPFYQTPTGAQYTGNQGQQLLQVDSARSIAINDSGSSVFENNKTGNGTFTTAAAAGNTGSGTIGVGSVSNPAALTNDKYAVSFTVVPSAIPNDPGTAYYAVQDTTTGMWMNPTTGAFDQTTQPAPPPAMAPALDASAYTSGQAITFAGMTLDISGAPANGDTFTVEPSQNQSIFTTLQNLLNTLQSNGQGATGQANLTNGLTAANANLDKALDNILNVRASIGTRLAELDTLDSSGSDMGLQYQTQISNLQDLDLAKTVSDFTAQQQALSAAQQSFAKVTGMSLFDYLS